MCVNKVWKLKYNTTEMTTATNEDCTGWLLKNFCFWGRNQTFDNERFKPIKGNFSDGENE